MKLGELLDAESAQALGFDWLEQAVSPVSAYGLRLFDELRPFRSGDEARAQSRAQTIANVASAVDAGQIEAARAALATLPDVTGPIARAAMGEVLGDPDLFELRQFAEVVERVDALLTDAPEIGAIANDATMALRDALALARSAAAEFYLADRFDPELAPARAGYAQAQAELDAERGREREAVARALGRDELAGDEFIVMRTDVRAALPAAVRVMREAPAYLLCALEPGDDSLAALCRRDAAAERVAVVEERVRAQLSSLVRERAPALNATTGAVGELDVTLGAVRFAQRYGCCAPTVTRAPGLAFEGGRCLPLEEELAAAGRRFAPLDLELNAAAVITGPNMGGKSVALQTCGFLALCCAFGLPVPATAATVCLFDQIAWLGTGRDERAGGLLSSFARELVALKTIWERPSPRLLMLADEFARTTTPHEGKALQVALLARLRERDACGMLATHLEGIATAANVRHFAVRGPDYAISEVSGEAEPGAEAIALAAQLGLDSDFVEAAYRALARNP